MKLPPRFLFFSNLQESMELSDRELLEEPGAHDIDMGPSDEEFEACLQTEWPDTGDVNVMEQVVDLEEMRRRSAEL